MTDVPVLDAASVDAALESFANLVRRVLDALRRGRAVVAFRGSAQALMGGESEAIVVDTGSVFAVDAQAHASLPAVDPRVLAGAAVDESATSFALGVALFRLLSGSEPPLPPATISEAIETIPVAGVPQMLWRTLASDPQDRWSVDEINARVEALVLERHARQSAHFGDLLVGVRTSIGRNTERIENEDALGSIALSLDEPVVVAACVADGMGGMEAGEVASASAVRAWIHALAEGDFTDPLAQNQAILDAVRRANQAVRTALEDRRGGCTFTGVLLVGRRLALAHVGDSRAYLAHASGALEALSRDHSLVASLVAVGALTPEEAIGHPDRNKILRCLGMADAEEDGYIDDLSSVGGDPSAATRELNPGDVILLLSDGVWGELIDSELSEVIARHRFDPQRLVDELVERAVAASGQDNATAVAVTVTAA